MAKAILLIRVSTESQTYEQQTKELSEFAIKDGGYDEKDLIIIETKESGKKKSEEERLGLNEMKEYIKNDPSIDCVYCREVNRVGRRYDVLTSMKSYFVNNKIQLVTADNNRRLLDDNKELSLEGSIMFEVACSLAVTEMRDKEIRFKQGKAKAVEEGRTVTGTVLFGYRIDDKTKRIEKDDEKYGNKAAVIEYIFDTYTKTSKSTKAIYKELSSQGLYTLFKRDDVGANQIRRIIMNRAYSGGINNNGDKNTRKVYNYKYPAIVSEEKQEAAIQKCRKAKNSPKYNHKHVYYAKSLLKCVCGHTMIGDASRNAYKCPYCNKYIGLNAIDYIAWVAAIVLKTQYNLQNEKEIKEKNLQDISNNERSIEILKAKLISLDDEDESSVRRCRKIANQTRADKLLDELLEETEKERRKTNQEILRLSEVNRQKRQFLANLSKNIDPTFTGAVAHIEDDDLRREIILDVIDGIELIDIDERHTRINVIPNPAITDQYSFYYIYDKTKTPYIRLYCYHNNGTFDDETKWIFKRFHQPPHKGRLLQKEEKLKKIGDKLSIDEVCGIYNYSHSTVYGYITRGILKGELINRKYYISPGDAERVFGGKNKQKELSNDELERIASEPLD